VKFNDNATAEKQINIIIHMSSGVCSERYVGSEKNSPFITTVN
jgi:hypothetical protein